MNLKCNTKWPITYPIREQLASKNMINGSTDTNKLKPNWENKKPNLKNLKPELLNLNLKLPCIKLNKPRQQWKQQTPKSKALISNPPSMELFYKSRFMKEKHLAPILPR